MNTVLKRELTIEEKRFYQRIFHEIYEEFVETHELDYNNACLEYGNRYVTCIVEAPNHLTLSLQINVNEVVSETLNDFEEILETDELMAVIKEDLLDELEGVYIKAVYELDIDEFFNEVWSYAFAEHNHFKPGQFMEMLEEDNEYFEEVYRQIIVKNRG
ncbi:hypothetical protein CIRMBP1247_01403 [Enterococcus cecorum]|nr:hypothetical protein CIRMBP1247_01403 [Enterococcus cecorum]